MEHLLIMEFGELKQLKGREPADEELAAAEAGDLTIIRFRGNQFEEATVTVRQSDIEHDVEEEGEEEDEDDEEIQYDVDWKPVSLV